MLRSQRLRSTGEFRRVFEHGRRASEQAVTCFCLRGEQDRPARVGVSASRKVGGAVQRNRAKRRLRAAVRMILPDIREGVDVVLVANPDTVTLPFQNVVDGTRRALGKACA